MRKRLNEDGRATYRFSNSSLTTDEENIIIVNTLKILHKENKEKGTHNMNRIKSKKCIYKVQRRQYIVT